MLSKINAKNILPAVVVSLLFGHIITAYATVTPPTTFLPNAKDIEPPPTLIGIYNWSHELWNGQNISAFLPFFHPVFFYVDHPSGHHIYTLPQMKTYASSIWNFSSDAKLVDRVYIKDNSTGLILMTGNMNGTNDVSIAFPATGNLFEIPLAETILWDEDRRALGGDMYYDRLSLIKDLGLPVNLTAPETPTPTATASPAPHRVPPGPAPAPSDDLRQRHNWLHEQFNERNLSAVASYIEPEIQYLN